MFGKKKDLYMVRVCHAEGFMNLAPTTLSEARELARQENKRWVELWHKHSSGARPVVEIWKFAEEVSGQVWVCDEI